MNSSLQPTNAEQSPSGETPVPAAAPAPKKGFLKPALIIGGVLAAVCLLTTVCVLVLGAGLMGVGSQKEDVTLVLDTAMRAMARQDAKQVYALFSKRAQRQAPVSKIEELCQGANRALFDGYVELQITNLNMSTQVNTNPDVPQGLVARVSANVKYEDGSIGNLQAVLEQEDGKWKLYGFNVTVPPQKFSNYMKKNP